MQKLEDKADIACKLRRLSLQAQPERVDASFASLKRNLQRRRLSPGAGWSWQSPMTRLSTSSIPGARSSPRPIFSRLSWTIPYDFGAIAAANALSDVYAMGGRPLMAINLVAYPDDLDKGILSEILRGGAEKVKEAGAVIAGGHSITDAEPKYGLSVTGEVETGKIIRKSGARALAMCSF